MAGHPGRGAPSPLVWGAPESRWDGSGSHTLHTPVHGWVTIAGESQAACSPRARMASRRRYAPSGSPGAHRPRPAPPAFSPAHAACCLAFVVPLRPARLTWHCMGDDRWAVEQSDTRFGFPPYGFSPLSSPVGVPLLPGASPFPLLERPEDRAPVRAILRDRTPGFPNRPGVIWSI